MKLHVNSKGTILSCIWPLGGNAAPFTAVMATSSLITLPSCEAVLCLLLGAWAPARYSLGLMVRLIQMVKHCTWTTILISLYFTTFSFNFWKYCHTGLRCYRVPFSAIFPTVDDDDVVLDSQLQNNRFLYSLHVDSRCQLPYLSVTNQFHTQLTPKILYFWNRGDWLVPVLSRTQTLPYFIAS